MKKFLMSYVYAFRGIRVGFRERNMKIHGFTTITTVLIGFILEISKIEWFVVVILITSVWCAELMNTAIENICNRLRDDLGLSYESTKDARDIAAGGVLMISVGAAIVGTWIFLPKLIGMVFLE